MFVFLNRPRVGEVSSLPPQSLFQESRAAVADDDDDDDEHVTNTSNNSQDSVNVTTIEAVDLKTFVQLFFYLLGR